jgi:hypothetical protein
MVLDIGIGGILFPAQDTIPDELSLHSMPFESAPLMMD